MARRFSPPQEWGVYIQQVLAEFGGVIPPGWTLDALITNVAACAGHPNPHSAIPGARKALKELMAEGKVQRKGGGSRAMPKRSGTLPKSKSLVPLAPKHLRPVRRSRAHTNGDGLLPTLVALAMETAEASEVMARSLSLLQRQMKELSHKQEEIEERRNSLREAMEELLQEE